MDKLIKLGREIQAQFPEYKEWDSEEIGLAVLAKARQERAYHDTDIIQLLDAVTYQVSANRGLIEGWFAKWRAEHDAETDRYMVQQMAAIREMLLERHAAEEQIYQYSIRPEVRLEEEERRRRLHELSLEKGLDPLVYQSLAAT